LKLLLIHSELMGMERAVFRIAIVGLAGLQSDRIIIASNGNQPIQL
jgi:hypothetical protein